MPCLSMRTLTIVSRILSAKSNGTRKKSKPMREDWAYCSANFWKNAPSQVFVGIWDIFFLYSLP